jgi:RimJ/RimL family protein N-acetyltransferase
VSDPVWPMFDLRLTTPRLELRHLTEADLPALATLIPEDEEHDPAATMYPVLSTAHQRAVIVYQEYWRARGNWRSEDWELTFAAFRGGDLVGYQGLEGKDFVRLRTVDSSSFLGPGVRGMGLGKEMRAAALTLAFGSLGAEFAVTSAWSDNHASLGVSRSLGYVDNGLSKHPRGDAVGTMTHLRLSRTDWLRSGWAGQVSVIGVEPCLPFFGLV